MENFARDFQAGGAVMYLIALLGCVGAFGSVLGFVLGIAIARARTVWLSAAMMVLALLAPACGGIGFALGMSSMERALTQVNPESLLYGNGDLRRWISWNFGLPYSADAYLMLEAGVAALNFAGIAFLIGAVTRSFAATMVSLIALIMTALALKTIASMVLFVPGNPGLWLTPGSVLGLVAGMMLWLPFARRSPAGSMRAAAVCVASGVFLVNLAPENPYLVAALQVLQHGQFLRFNAMTELLSSAWPFLVFVYLAFLLRGRARETRRPAQ